MYSQESSTSHSLNIFESSSRSVKLRNLNNEDDNGTLSAYNRLSRKFNRQSVPPIYLDYSTNYFENFAGANPVLTVALQPLPKVDYSVTKGGARTWIVLLVFIFLCSSLYTIFSNKELGESKHDLNMHQTDSSEDDHLFTSEAETIDDSDESIDEYSSKKQDSYGTQQKKAVPSASVDADDDDEEEEETKDHSLGGRLFAGLRRKISDRLMETIGTSKENEKSSKKEKQLKEEKPKLKTLKKLNKKKQVNEDNDQDDDTEVENKKKERSVTVASSESAKKGKNRKEERYRKPTPVAESEEDDDDEDEDDEDDDNEDDDDDDDDDNDDNKKNNDDDDNDNDEDDDDDDDDDDDNDVEKTKPKNNAANDVDKSDEENMNNDDSKKNENDNDDADSEPKNAKKDELEMTSKQLKLLRRQQQRAQRGDNRVKSHGKRECLHMDCPDFESVKPRKSLLFKKRKNTVLSEVLDDFDDNDEDDDDDEDSETSFKTSESQNRRISDDNDENDDPKFSEKDRSSSYKRHAITTKEEIGFRSILDRADHLVEKHEYERAMELFDHVIDVYPSSTRAYFGKARAYDIRGEIEARESDRDRAIEIYQKILENPSTPEALFRQAAKRLIEQTRFRGLLHQTLVAHRLYIDRFPEELALQTDFAVTFVMMKRYEDARTVLKNVLANDPNNVIALAYYGYILKAHDNKVEQGVALMRKSLKLADAEIKDPKFYYQLGHGLTSLGKKSEAEAVYQKAAQMGVFMTAQQRSLYNINGLTARPWWNIEQTPYSKFLKTVERQWATIRQEGMEVLRDNSENWLDHNQQLVIDGQWKYFPLMSDQKFIKSSCKLMPQTCLILKEFDSSSNATKSEMYLSVLSSGGQILPHCGPTNYQLQAHLGLVSPSEARIRVGNETRGWRSGKFIIFDESFEHEMQFDGASSSAFRLVLVLQLWHPEVQSHQRVLSFLT